MVKLDSSNPLFVDLFYGVVVGSAIASMHVKAPSAIVFQVLWVLAVLEDWFLYYSYVVDEETNAVSYSFKSLLIELSILTAWFLGFDALSDDATKHLFFPCAAVFYGVKIFGGVTFNIKHGTFFTRNMLYDCVWTIPVAFAVCYHFNRSSVADLAITIFAVATAASLSSWWMLKRCFP